MTDPGKPSLSDLRLTPEEKVPAPGRPAPQRNALLVGIAAFAAGALGVALLRGAGSRQRGEAAPASTAPSAPAAAAAGAVTGQAPQAVPPPASTDGEVAAGGYVEARRTAVLLPGREGIVARVLVSQGQAVRKGDLLLELDSRLVDREEEMARAELAKARAQLRLSEAGFRSEEIGQAAADVESAESALAQKRSDLDRLEKLFRDRLVPEADVEKGRNDAAAAAALVKAKRERLRLLERGNREAEVQAARAEVERLEAGLRLASAKRDLSRLVAPFDAVVVRFDLQPGEVVSYMSGTAGGKGIEVADVSELRVRVDVPESRIGAVKVGSPATVEVDALGGTRLQGSVVEVVPVAKRQSNTVEVVVRLEGPPALLRPDMSARVRIAPAAKEGTR